MTRLAGESARVFDRLIHRSWGKMGFRDLAPGNLLANADSLFGPVGWAEPPDLVG